MLHFSYQVSGSRDAILLIEKRSKLTEIVCIMHVQVDFLVDVAILDVVVDEEKLEY